MAKPALTNQRFLFATLLVLAVVVAYAGTLRVPFLFDDTVAVLNNPTIRRLSFPEILVPPADGGTTTGRPLVNASFAVNYAISGEQAWSYHAANVLIHAACALLLMQIVAAALRSMPGIGLAGGDSMPGDGHPSGPLGTRCPPRVVAGPPVSVAMGPGQRFSTAHTSDLVAFAVALLWAVHPLQTETVISPAQRTESLCTLFYLVTLHAFIRAAATRGPSRGWLIGSVISCFAGMATKEVMVTAPLVVLLYDRTFVAGTFGAAWRARRLYYAALAASWVLLGALLAHSGGSRGVAAGFGLGISPWEYLLTQTAALVRYVGLAIWPHPLVFDYGTAVARSPAEVGWQALLVLSALGITGWALGRKPRLGFALASFWLILAPSSSVVPLVTQTVAEHRMYLPLACLIAMAVVALAQIGPRAGGRLVAMVAVGCTVLTVVRGLDYRDELTLWTDTVAKVPNSARAENNLALAYCHAGRLPDANPHFARAVALDPKYIAARQDWAMALLDQNREGEALSQFETAIRLAEAAAPDAAALAGNRDVAEAHYHIAKLAERTGRLTEAEKQYEVAIALVPTLAAAHAELGLLLARSERLAAAAEHLEAALRLQPDDVDARANLGNVRLLQGDPRAAIAAYEEVLRVRPGDRRTMENLQLAREAMQGK